MTDGLNKEGQTKAFLSELLSKSKVLSSLLTLKISLRLKIWDRRYSSVRAESTVLFLSFERLSCQFETPYPV